MSLMSRAAPQSQRTYDIVSNHPHDAAHWSVSELRPQGPHVNVEGQSQTPERVRRD